VYDMYYWDQPNPPARGGTIHPGHRPGGARRSGRAVSATERPGPAVPAGGSGPAAQAVQVALDRRDNGGDSSATSDQ
jgi:hypothetical protein